MGAEAFGLVRVVATRVAARRAGFAGVGAIQVAQRGADEPEGQVGRDRLTAVPGA